MLAAYAENSSRSTGNNSNQETSSSNNRGNRGTSVYVPNRSQRYPM